jgi:SH3 domain-containing YSC84-like protein 1
MRKAVLLPLLILGVCLPVFSQDRDKVLNRIDDAGTILKEIMAAPDSGIPDNVIGNAECVAVIPSYLKGAFVVGAQYGKGVASCKTEHGWSAPAFFRIEGGSFGFQIGGQAIDLIMLIMNENGMRALLQSKFKVGADASAAVGPVGRHADASTDWKMRAQVLTYSRARGVFAGISLNGAVIKQDRDDTRAFYGRMVPYRSLLTGLTPVPADARPFLDALAQYAPVVPAPAAAPKSSGQ